MRASIIIAAHNEGQSLWKTVRSCIESIGKLDHEILIADDASDDEGVEEATRRFPHLSVHRHKHRQGASPTKHSGASNARGEVLVFLDGHCNPERDAIERLVEDVERLNGQSIVTPTILALDATRWKNKAWQVGHGYRLELDTFDCGWLPLASLSKVRRAGRQFYESPAAIGCALAVHRELYDDLRGFDPHMRIWGVEDLDFSLKCWLMGRSIVHDPEARIGHRFRDKFDNYDVPVQCILVNKLRMAYKNFTQAVWFEWVERCRQEHSGSLKEHPEGLWACAWNLFEADRASAEQERAYLLARRPRDEFWYAQQFGLSWPRLEEIGSGIPGPRVTAMREQGGEDPSASPPPGMVDIDIEFVPDDREETVGALVVRRHAGNNARRKKITLKTDIATGAVRLSLQNSRLRVFTEADGGVELSFNGDDNVFPVSALPKPLWVQGHLPSASMGDTSLTLTHLTEGATNRVIFTVLWVVVTAKHAGVVSEDNSGRDIYKITNSPPSLNLGPHFKVYPTEGAYISRSSEFIGTVSPKNFDHTEFGGALRLNRKVISGKHWWGKPDGNEKERAVEPRSDLSPENWRDDEPQSGMEGVIYDLDGPGSDALFTSNKNTIKRYRVNFRAWAEYNDVLYDDAPCSEEIEWYTRQSHKLTGPVGASQATAGTVNTLTDAKQTWTADAWAGGAIKIFEGAAKNDVRKIASNTATTLTIQVNWSKPVDATSKYILVSPATWEIHNDVPNDNENSNGTTKLSWNLE